MSRWRQCHSDGLARQSFMQVGVHRSDNPIGEASLVTPLHCRPAQLSGVATICV